ncbi:hypothetical protein BC936DRAFT_145226 [Jimgerdemannia flammicorona]|uniref:Uncharacterized protein n=2 Tax=Jimgerdemannia flammicorona TaxID=994334 RepID=A0A433DNH6_9FUNG|nr:hypothetical protein BC936DRAFT_145226 [Jimgerdemannia flammicorona]RUS32024.1 hypothetical protein BC938DRAFT_476471 [Jimgerdemannia flammicorona]
MTGMFQSDLHVVQSRRKFIEDAQLQRWQFCEEGFFYPLHDSNLVLDIRGDSDVKGTSILLYRRKETDNDNQLWKIEPLNSEPLDEPLEIEGPYNVSGDPFSFSEQEEYPFTMSGHSVWSSF